MQPPKEKQIVIKAINDLGRRVSAADVATKTGLPVALVTSTLNQVAAETNGRLQVSGIGDIAYQFPIGYQTTYLTKGMERLIEQFAKQAFQIGFFLLRISFGIMLILSLVIIVLIFVLIVFAASRNRNDDDFNFNFDFFDWMILRELIFWNFNYPVITYDGYGTPVKRVPEKSNFLYNCFSFLFGDGDPNANIEERRWQTIAQLIRQHNGAITIDQLSPYIGSNPNNEDAILPVLVRFDGTPAVSDTGNIVYLFPSLQATAAISLQNKPGTHLNYLNEFPWQFSQLEIESMAWVILLAGANFFGSWWLYLQAIKIPTLTTLAPLLLILVIYGTLFVTIPLIRFLVIQILNVRIEASNKLKEEYASKLIHPDQKLRTKLSEARQMSLTGRQIKSDGLVYDTQKEVLEQEFPAANGP